MVKKKVTVTPEAKLAALTAAGVDIAALNLTEKSSAKDLDAAMKEHDVTIDSGSGAGKGDSITVTYQSLGKFKTRTFSEAEHGKAWRKAAEQFIESGKLADGENRHKYISHVEE